MRRNVVGAFEVVTRHCVQQRDFVEVATGATPTPRARSRTRVVVVYSGVCKGAAVAARLPRPSGAKFVVARCERVPPVAAARAARF